MKGCRGLSDVHLCVHAPIGAYAYTSVRYSEGDRTNAEQSFEIHSPKLFTAQKKSADVNCGF